MSNETPRQAHIRILRKRLEITDSLNPTQLEVVMVTELINDGCLDGVVFPNGDGFPVRTETKFIKLKGRLRLQQLEKEESEAAQVRQHREDFKSLDRRKIARLEDKLLAEWQSGFKQDEPEWRIAEHEWQRRLTARQIRSAYIVAVVGIIGTLSGVFLGYYLLHSPVIQPQGKASAKTDIKQPIDTPPSNMVVVPITEPLLKTNNSDTNQY